ncbi:MAG: [FeFe] hydrogenase H-cluster maturation GTPase HydF [Chitinispirillales bacterium]|jgi:[FeFe] hydrogenase H-cluster maturation GTPase HydF|nr:[FeFe] hydrogenase H-cluster maturation GTPase HydF [Chitinispirillales bacterium]
MREVPKSIRTHIGIFGRANVGKSSFLNMVASQDVSIVSPIPGTTADVVEKPMELGAIGPVVFLDTAGVDDATELSESRIKRTTAAFSRADVFVVVTEADCWGEYEEGLCAAARNNGASVVAVVNKTDVHGLTDGFRQKISAFTPHIMACSCVDGSREAALAEFKKLLSDAGAGGGAQRALVSDLVPAGGLAVLVVPIDSGAPKGRLILPQAQALRDLLDGGAVATVVRDTELKASLAMFSRKPDLVVCDSQAVKRVVEDTPPDVRCTTFSILFARQKGDLARAFKGAKAIAGLKSSDRVLIAEACTHHAADSDIGRIKIPNMLRKHVGGDIHIDVFSGRDYPEDLERYALIIHCGACMITSREMSARIRQAVSKNVPITNYGIAISYFQGVLDRVMEPFGLG